MIICILLYCSIINYEIINKITKVHENISFREVQHRN